MLQLGLAMMMAPFFDWLRARVATSMLISGTTRGIAGSLRQAEELSMTVAPASTKRGAYCREAPAPAEKMA